MKKSTILLLSLGCAVIVGELMPGAGRPGGVLIKDAQAIVGRPMTPVSVAGVSRRTTRRMIVATSVTVAALPPACTVVVVEGTTLHLCGTTYYQPSGTQFVVVKHY
ncbi:MAG: hypothetical protein HGA21_13270 [Burkholderiaceae bacterium]|nr:hypothetical protein [Burkholderiaceae bacterium]